MTRAGWGQPTELVDATADAALTAHAKADTAKAVGRLARHELEALKVRPAPPPDLRDPFGVPAGLFNEETWARLRRGPRRHKWAAGEWVRERLDLDELLSHGKEGTSPSGSPTLRFRPRTGASAAAICPERECVDPVTLGWLLALILSRRPSERGAGEAASAARVRRCH